MNTYYLVRHGQTHWNTEGRTQGHGNSDLTELGIKQAENLAEVLKKYPIDTVYCSDLGRAVQTAEIIANKLGIDYTLTANLREMGFGIWEGMKLKIIEKEYADMFSIWRNKPDILEVPGGEKLIDIKNRQDALIEKLNTEYDGKHILLVSHSVTVRVMLLSFLESSLKNLYRIKQDNTALNIVEYRDYGPVVIKMNDTSHLESKNISGDNKAGSALE
ncbi:histidine phosphatase family protein [Peptostreptococcus equinus]|uniref:Histidine phosphatase family protein n=1 Tax=Peptostreptococcus equinus TaxID=3003601 RepID=A0ABY7JS85_9FIRM|nr:histidine phosphatase family protein [Peptostreptococcus sp. CBA3647]WAW15711.1 histidine phosphatase family protein [Peptostreptococcus sp. CBA3647]